APPPTASVREAPAGHPPREEEEEEPRRTEVSRELASPDTAARLAAPAVPEPRARVGRPCAPARAPRCHNPTPAAAVRLPSAPHRRLGRSLQGRRHLQAASVPGGARLRGALLSL